MNDTYELYAIKYGSVTNRPMSENFIGGDPHDFSQNLDYFIWVATNSERTHVIDTGFNHEVAADRGGKIDRLPREGLELLGIDAGKVEDVIITHLHYDHAGTFGDSIDHVIPGHDPAVLDYYPAPDPSLEGIAVRLDVAPKVSIA